MTSMYAQVYYEVMSQGTSNNNQKGAKMSAKEIANLKREFGKVTQKQLMKVAYERAHDVSEERFILRRIPLCS